MAETAFSAIKRTLSHHLTSTRRDHQKLELIIKVIVHSITVLVKSTKGNLEMDLYSPADGRKNSPEKGYEPHTIMGITVNISAGMKLAIKTSPCVICSSRHPQNHTCVESKAFQWVACVDRQRLQDCRHHNERAIS